MCLARAGNLVYRITDQSGKDIYISSFYDQTNVVLDSFPAGLYIGNVYNDAGRKLSLPLSGIRGIGKMNASGSDLVVIGGGAAGFFGAIQCAERDPDTRIIILEKSEKVLTKVKISGGGRCNVTYACFDPSEMVILSQREKELLDRFHSFYQAI